MPTQTQIYRHGSDIVGAYSYTIILPFESNSLRRQIYASLLEMWLKRNCRNQWNLCAYERDGVQAPLQIELGFQDACDLMFFKLTHNNDELYELTH